MDHYKKISLYRSRNMGENFDITFEFFKQNFGTMAKHLSCLLPVMFVASYLLTTNAINVDSFSQSDINLGLIIGYLLAFGSSVFAITYVVAYIAEYAVSNDKPLLPNILKRVKSLFLPLLGGQILYGIVLAIGLILCLVPGIYIGIALIFFFFIYSNEDVDLIDSLKKSYELIKGNWWNTFGYILVLSVMAYIIILLASIPNIILTLSGNENFLALFVYYAVTMYVSSVVYIGIGMYYFSMRDKVDGVNTFDEIDKIGADSDMNNFPSHFDK